MALSVGIVGLGGRGRTQAADVETAGHEVAAGADVDADARQSFAATFGADVYDDHEELLAAGVDALVVTTPNAYHAPAAVAALERGVPVLCEKPLADELAAAERIAEAARDSPAFCMVGVDGRFSAAGEIITGLREAGRLGEVRHVQANYVRRRGIPGVGTWFTRSETAGGGALLDIGVHALDFALYLAGFPAVESVSGVVRTDHGSRPDYANPDGGWADDPDGTFDVDDSASAFLRCADGTTVDLEAAWAANREPTQSVVLDGTAGGVRTTVGGDTVELFEVGTEGEPHYADTTLTTTLDPAGHEAQMQRFLEGVETGEAPDVNTVEEGLAVQRVLDAVYRSSESGREIRL